MNARGEPMKRLTENQKSIPEGNEKGLAKAELDSVLSDLIKTFEDTNKMVDQLLAKVKA